MTNAKTLPQPEVGSFSSPEISRRRFVAGGVAAGFALAVQPVSAQTIHTDANGLVAGDIQIKGSDGIEFPAYRAMPARGRKFPVVLVIQEIFGIHEHIRDVCRRFAKQGYLAIAPSLYHRQGDVTTLPMNEIFPIVQKVPDAQVMADLDATVAWAKARGKGDTTRLAVTGFCWGGRITWLYSAHSPQVRAGAAWYGRLVGQASPLQPQHPVDIAGALKAPVLGLYGALDRGIPQESVEAMRAALKAAGKTNCEIIVYPDAEHGFHADYRPSYNEKDAKDAFAKLLAWFKKNGA